MKITRQIPGQIAQVSYTQAANSLMNSLKVQDEDNHIVKKQRVSIDQSPVSSPQITVVQSPVVTSPSIVTTPKIEQVPPPSGQLDDYKSSFLTKNLVFPSVSLPSDHSSSNIITTATGSVNTITEPSALTVILTSSALTKSTLFISISSFFFN